jgi:uroporphyrinogen-III synthase
MRTANPVRVIVTRPEREAHEWVEALGQRGFDAHAFPLIEIGPSDNPADAVALQTAWKTLFKYSACMFVSGNAVSHFFESNRPPAQLIPAQAAIETIAIVQPFRVPPQTRFLAPGPGTAAALRAAGVPADQIDGPAADAQQFDSQSLWQNVGQRDWQGCRVLIVRGQTLTGHREAPDAASAPGRDWIAGQWTAAGATVDFLRVYVRRPPVWCDLQLGQAQRALADGSIWLLSSSEAALNLASMNGFERPQLSRARAVATHPRIAEAARAAGWGVVVESRPQLEDVSEALAKFGSIESGHP